MNASNIEILLIGIIFLLFVGLVALLTAGSAATNAARSVTALKNDALKTVPAIWSSVQAQVAKANPQIHSAVSNILKGVFPGVSFA